MRVYALELFIIILDYFKIFNDYYYNNLNLEKVENVLFLNRRKKFQKLS